MQSPANPATICCQASYGPLSPSSNLVVYIHQWRLPFFLTLHTLSSAMSTLQSYMMNGSSPTVSSMDQSSLTLLPNQTTPLKWNFDEIFHSNPDNNLAGDCGFLEGVIAPSWSSPAADFEPNGWYSFVNQVCGNGEITQNKTIGAASSVSAYREAEQDLTPECASSEDRGSENKPGGGSSKKRMTARKSPPRCVKKKVGGEDERSQITDKTNTRSGSVTQKRETLKKEHSGETSKDESKVTEVQKTDYIHVRARRGQATDSHSLAERVRREKISERMKYLQNLVPGCNKVTGKAGMLDEIINYVQALQRQVEFLSMKLACVYPVLDLGAESLYPKETFPFGHSNITYPFGDTSHNPPYPMKQETQDAFHPTPESFIAASGSNTIHHQAWDTEIHGLYNLAFYPNRSTSFQQMFSGPVELGNVKMEM